jgi:hypothetical protein
MQTNEATLEEAAQSERFAMEEEVGLPSVVIGITDNKTRKHKKEVNSQVTMIESVDSSTSGKGKALEYVIPYYHQGCGSTKTVQDFEVGLTIGKRG